MASLLLAIGLGILIDVGLAMAFHIQDPISIMVLLTVTGAVAGFSAAVWSK